MAMTHRSRAVAWLLAGAASLGGACRVTNICEGDECASEAPSAAAGSGGKGPLAHAGTDSGGNDDAGGGGEGGLGDADGGRSDGGDAPIGAGAGAGGEGEQGLACETDMADCDGSRLTGCETNLTWNVRHCGGCAQECDGLCLSGRCEPTLLVQSAYPVRMVATAVTGFAIATQDHSHYALLKIDMESGSPSTLLDDLNGEERLALSGDRLYIYDSNSASVRSARLDGTDMEQEDIAWPSSVGGTQRGAYYVNVLEHAETPADEDYEYQLFYRATGTTKWQLLRQGAEPIRIISSSAGGMLLGSYELSDSDDDAGELSLWDGATSSPIDDKPASWTEAKVIDEDRVVFLTYDDSRESSQLWWSHVDGSSNEYDIEEPRGDSAETMLVLDDVVVIYFQKQGRGYLQQFDREGAKAGRQGVPNESNLVWADRTNVWYGVYDTWITSRFLRSQWFDLKF